MPTRDGLNNVGVAIPLSAGEHRIMVETEGDGSGEVEQVRLAWATPAARRAQHAAAVAAAKGAHKAVVFAWARVVPAFGLPGEQDRLIADVAAVNPNTIVVLNVSQPVALPWLDKVEGGRQMWWPGDQGGEATADVLLGRVSPAGRLPFTWARRLADYPATDPAYPERSAAGVGGVTTYSEGLDIGYRWFDRQKTVPLFAFGHGLSYTRFTYSQLRTTTAPRRQRGGAFYRPQRRHAGGRGGCRKSICPRRDGGAPGAEFPVKILAGFARTPLGAGQSREISIQLPAASLSILVDRAAWMASSAGRAPADGRRIVGRYPARRRPSRTTGRRPCEGDVRGSG